MKNAKQDIIHYSLLIMLDSFTSLRSEWRKRKCHYIAFCTRSWSFRAQRRNPNQL